MASKKDKTQITSAINLFSQSYEVVMRNIKTFSILLALPLIASVASTINYHANASDKSRWAHFNIFSGTMPAYSIVGVVGLGILLFVGATIIALILQAMITGLEINGAKDKTPTFADLWKIGKKFWLRLFGLNFMIVLYMLIAAVAGLIVFPLFLLVHRVEIALVLYIIWMTIALVFIILSYFLAPYVLVDQDKSIFDALGESSKLAKGHYSNIVSVIAVAALLGFTGVVPVIGPVISFILGSLYAVAPALRYLELKKLS